MSDENPYSPPEASVEPPPVAGVAQLAGRGKRLIAAILDWLIVGAIMIPLVMMTAGGSLESAAMQTGGLLATLGWTAGGYIVYLLIHGYLLAKRGQTIGKWALNIKIVSVETGEILSLGKVFFVRIVPVNLIASIPLIGMVVALVNYLFIFREDRRCGHDFLAGTRVVEA